MMAASEAIYVSSPCPVQHVNCNIALSVFDQFDDLISITILVHIQQNPTSVRY